MPEAMTMTDNIRLSTISPSDMDDTLECLAAAQSQKAVALSSTQRVSNLQSGFTLIEIMVVIVILAILAGLVVPKVVGQSDKTTIINRTVYLRVIKTSQPSHSYSQLAASPPLR